MKEKIIFLVVISYLVRLLLSPFFIAFPYIPHDYYAYGGAGEAMMNGDFFMETSQRFQPFERTMSLYGPFFASLMSVFYMMFGVFDIFMFKISAIIFDVMSTVMIYLIARKILGEKNAFYVGLMYCFSFILLLNSAVIGDDSVYSLFFVFASVYFLMEKRPMLSAVFFSTAIMFRFSPWIMFFPPLCYYVLQKWKFSSLIKYVTTAGVAFLIMLLPFVFLGGSKATYYIFGAHTGFQQSIEPYSILLSIYHVFKLVTNININSIALYALAAAYSITFCIIFIKKMENSEIELVRNIGLVGIVGLLFGPGLSGVYMNWIVLPIFILFGTKLRGCKITKQWVIGVTLIFFSLLIYSAIYREGVVQYSNADRLLLLGATIMAPIGVYNFMHFIKKYRIVWVLVVFATIMCVELDAAPLLAMPIKDISEKLVDPSSFTVINKMYGDHVQGKPEKLIAYGSFYVGSAVILWLCLGFLYYSFLKDNWIALIK
jgi:hypothetical protein